MRHEELVTYPGSCRFRRSRRCGHAIRAVAQNHPATSSIASRATSGSRALPQGPQPIRSHTHTR